MNKSNLDPKKPSVPGDEYLEVHEDIKSNHSDDGHLHKKAEDGEGPWLISYADLMTLLMGFFALIASFSKPDIKAFEAVKKSSIEKFGGKYKEPYQEIEEKIKKELTSEINENKVKLERAADGLTIKTDGTMFFESGTFVVNETGALLIQKITTAIRSEIPTHSVIVEGHTDNVPISHPIIGSNWELSAIRAARIAQLLEQQGFKKEQLTIQGWGETKPEVPNLDESGQPLPFNQAKNRRVVIKIFHP